MSGLVAAVVAMALMLMVDVLTPDRSWWSTPSIFGSLFTGVRNFNTSSPDMGSLVLGIVAQLVVFALVGVGFVYYRPIFRRLNVNLILGGMIYGAVMNLAFLLSLLAVKPDIPQRQNNIALFLADVIAGAAMGWCLMRLDQIGRKTR